MDEDIEQKYELLVDNLLDIIVELDLNGNFIFISPQSVDITGYPHDEIIGTSIYQCIHPNDLSILKNAIEDTKIDGNHISLEFRIKNKNGHYIYLSAKGRSVDIDGKQKIILLVSELSKNKGELKESEKILNKIIDQTFIGFAILQDFEVKFLNPKFSEVIGYSYEEIMNWKSKEVFKIIHPQDRKELISLAQEVYLGNNEALNSFQFRVIKKSGVPIWLEIQTKPINYKDNKADLIFLQDITSYKEAEQKLIESEERYRVLFENSPYAIGLINKEGIIVHANTNNEKLSGYKREDIIGRKFTEYSVFSLKDTNIIIDSFKKLLKGEIPEPQELLLHKKDGSKTWVLMQASILKLDNEPVFQIITQDISNQKVASEKLKESEERYRLISEHTNDLINVIDDKFRYEYINEETHKKVLGYSKEDMIGKFAAKYVHPDDMENIVKKLREGFEKGIGMTECRIKKKDGTYVWYESKGNTFIDQHGNKKALIMSRDITERKLAVSIQKEVSEKLKEKNIELSALNRIISLGSESTNLKEFLIKSYDQVLDIVGFDRGGVYLYNPETHHNFLVHHKNVHNDFIAAVEDVDISTGVFSTVFDKNNPFYIEDFSEFMENSKDLGVYSAVIIPLRSKDKYVGSLNIGSQIHQILSENQLNLLVAIGKQMGIIIQKFESERSLKESEEKFRTLAEQSIMGIAIVQDDNISYANQAVLDIFGYSMEAVNNWQPLEFLELFPPKDREFILGQERKQLDGFDRSKHNYEVQFIKKNGEIGWLDLFSTPIEYKGKLGGMVSFIDITERKIAEQQLHKKEELLLDSQRIAKLGHWEWNLQNQEFYWSDEVYRIYKRPKSYKPNIQEWLQHVYPEDFEKNFSSVRENITSGDVHSKEFRIVCTDGEIKHIRAEWEINRDDKNAVNRVFGTILDITEQKLAEQKLKESEERLKILFKYAPDAYYLNDMEGNFVNGNDAAECLIGYKKEELIGKNFSRILPEHQIPLAVDLLRKNKNGITVKTGEILLKHKDGREIPVEISAHPIKINDRHLVLGIARDITERKIVEEKTRKSENLLAKAQEIAHLGHWEWDIQNKEIFWSDELYRINKLPQSFKPTMQKWLQFVHPDDFKKNFSSLQEHFSSGNVHSKEFRIVCPDSEVKHIRMEWEIDRDSKNKIIGLFGTVLDITEQKLAEQKLKESEEKYRHIFENSPFSIMLFNSEGIIKDCNSVSEEMFGFNKDEFLGQNYFNNPSINTDYLPITKQRFEQIKKGGSLHPQELKIHRADGTFRWMNSQVSKIMINNQRYFYSIIQDITNKKILEDLMFELNQNFFNFTSDFQENIQSLTQTAKKLSKGNLVLYAKKVFHEEGSTIQIITSENEVINCNFTDFQQKYFINEIFNLKHETPNIFPNLDKNMYAMDPFIQIYNSNGAYGKIIKSLDDFVSIIVILYEKVPEISYEEQLVLLLISDAIAIEEKQWQLLEKLEEQNTKLSELDKLKSEFLTRISHELKTPLISIKGYSQLLLYNNKGIFDNDTLSMIEEITRGCVRLENLIRELIESSKLESAQVKLKLKFEDLALLINNSVKELQGVAKSRNQEIILTIHEKLITKFEKERMHEVVGNLLTNAIKYSPPSNSIVIKSEIKDGFYVISVKDNGIGFTPGEKKKLFNQFGKIDRFDQETNLAAEGSGLGLYITKKLVELHGGKIWVESEGRNKGSTFYFTLPIIKD